MRRTNRSLEGILLGVLVAGALIETALTVLSAWFPNAAGGYGAPFEVGDSPGLAWFPIRPRPTTFDPLIFALDVGLSALLFLLLARWSGWLGVGLGVIGALVSLALFIVMGATGVPIAGLPIPIFLNNPLPVSLVLWVDMFFWAGAFAALVRWRRHRTAAAQPWR